MPANPADTAALKPETPVVADPEADRVLSARTIDRIARFHGDGLPVVSIYLAVGAGPDARKAVRTKASSLVHRIRSVGEDRSLDHDARMSLRQDIDQIEAVVRHARFRPGTLAIFSCSRAGLLEAVSLPRALRDRIMVDETPWTRPLRAVLDEYHRCCAVVVDRESAHVWELYLGVLRDAGRLNGRTLRNPAYAGWHGLTEHRVRNKADELSKRHFREVVTALDHRFRTERYDVFVVGGHQYELPAFVEFLPRSMRERVVGTFSIDPHTATPAMVREHAEAILDRYELDNQRRLVAEVLQTAASGGLGVVGLAPCLWAGSVAAARALVVQEGAISPRVVCDASGWFPTSGEICPLCGGPTRRTPDVIDELVEAVIDEGGSIHHVRADAELREYLAAALLRFPLPPAPDDTDGVPG
jgi:peptide chain release factor subunit 1